MGVELNPRYPLKTHSHEHSRLVGLLFVRASMNVLIVSSLEGREVMAAGVYL